MNETVIPVPEVTEVTGYRAVLLMQTYWPAQYAQHLNINPSLQETDDERLRRVLGPTQKERHHNGHATAHR